jgi:hypothetical protein
MPHPLPFLPTRALARLAVVTALVGGSAVAGCTLDFSANLLPYQALADTTGSLELDVSCERPSDQFQLALLTPDVRRRPGTPDGTLELRLMGVGQGGVPLKLLLQNAAGPLGGPGMDARVYTGSQHFSLPLVVPAGQWNISGSFSFNLRLKLQSLPGQAGR